MNEALTQKVIERARADAAKDHLAVCIAVVDPSGLLCGFLRMDDTLLGSIDISIKKARTAVLFKSDSADLGVKAQPGGPLYSLENSNGGLISFGGGILIHDKSGRIIGAIGVSGAAVEEDEAIARAGAGRP